MILNKTILSTGRILISVCLFAAVIFIPSAAFSREKVKFIKEYKSDTTQPADVAVSVNGVIFVLDEVSGRVIVYDTEGVAVKNFGLEDQGEISLIQPKALYLGSNGKLAIADTGNHRIVVLDQKGELQFKFGSMGDEAGQFRTPVSLVMDRAGFFYVADQENRRIQVFSPKGVFLEYFSLEAPPAAVAIDKANYLYVLIPDLGKVLKYDHKGNKENEIMCFVNGRNIVERATALSVDDRGDIYIIEGVDNGIKKFDQGGNLLISFGSYGDGRGQFANPQGIKTDPDEQIYVADKDNGRVQVLRITGNSRGPLKEAPARELIVDFYSETEGYQGAADLFHNNDTIFILSAEHSKVSSKGRKKIDFGSFGIEPGDFTYPRSIFVGWDDKIYVANTGGHGIQIFEEDGTLEYQFGREGENPGEFNAPYSVAVNSKGIIFVSDTNNNRIQFFNNDGIYLGIFGESQEDTEGELIHLRYPKALAIDSRDRVFVVDSDGGRIMVFDSEGKFLGKMGDFKEDRVRRKNIVDLCFDENDNLFLLDALNSQVKIVNRYGEHVASFGAKGSGRGYFKSVSALAVGEGKIYIADYDSNKMQIFRYYLDGLINEERIFATKMMECEEVEDLNIIARYTKTIAQAVSEARKELNKDLNFLPKKLKEVSKIDSIEKVNNGQVKVTVSMPRYLLEGLVEKEPIQQEKVIHESIQK